MWPPGILHSQCLPRALPSRALSPRSNVQQQKKKPQESDMSDVSEDLDALLGLVPGPKIKCLKAPNTKGSPKTTSSRRAFSALRETDRKVYVVWTRGR